MVGEGRGKMGRKGEGKEVRSEGREGLEKGTMYPGVEGSFRNGKEGRKWKKREH